MGCDANVADFLLEGKGPDRQALRQADGDHTYGELQQATLRVSRYLQEAEGQPGDRVLLIGESGLFWVAAYLGAMKAGLVSVPLPAGISAVELDFIREATAAKMVFVQAPALVRNAQCFMGMDVVTDSTAPHLPALSSQHTFQELRVGASGPGWPCSSSSADCLAALMFTSGSTGKPRGVMISHANIIANTESIIEYLSLTEHDRILAVLPFHYCFGASLLHTHLRVGGSLVVEPQFVYPEVVLERMLETGCTGFAGVPSHFQILLRSSSLRKKNFPQLRYVQQAGGCLPKPFLSDLRQALPRTQIFVMYGQTEATARLSYLPPGRLDAKLGSIGKGIPGVRLRVLDERGEEVRPGVVGEIVAEGRNVGQGYWRAPEESASTFRDGRLYTGDLATVDEDGFLYIVDRAKDFLKCRGERVSCLQLEEKLLECADLLEAAVVGVPDGILGEAVKAFVVARDKERGGVAESLLLFCKKRLPPHLLPKEVVVLPALPKNSAGKVLKASLRGLPQGWTASRIRPT
jgi:long-chain acyl-CoA synthetase